MQVKSVKPLPLVEHPAGVLAFDFDGTLHWPDHQPPVDPRLLEWIEFLRERRQFIWGICTGRSLMHLVEGLTGTFPFLPDFVVARERELHFPNRLGRFTPDEEWNRKCDRDHRRLFKKVRRELAQVRAYVEEVAGGEWVEVEGDLAGVVLPDESEMEGLLAEVAKTCGARRELGYERNGIYLRFSHYAYGKGPALKEVAQRLGLGPGHVLAAGDNFNDLSMFEPEVTAWPVCPGNAVAEVKARVREYGGVVGESEASAGLVEAFEEIFLQQKWI